MKKSHGPSLEKEVIELAPCRGCRGVGFYKDLFFPKPCMKCNASGWVAAATGEAVPLEELVTQLNMKLRAMARQLDQLTKRQAIGPEAQYQTNNRRGAGGTNYTGD
ncbi:hypothetical protein IV505_14840 [Pseudomonas fulva]|nr:hypothetical protein [Pseudomonas fulva]MBF8780991.1 hypothetical protein [Pseudomonas fulva]